MMNGPRQRGRPFAPGVSGNPAGRPPLGLSVAGYVRLRGGEDGRIYIDQLHAIATNRRANIRARISALGILLERGYGKPPQALEGPSVNIAAEVASLTDEQLQSGLANLDKLLAALTSTNPAA